MKGSWFLSTLAGWVLGGAVFMLLEKLWPVQKSQTIAESLGGR